MLTLKSLPPDHPDFLALVKKLDADLAERDGEEHDFYHQFNSPSNLDVAMVAYADGNPIACGGMKLLEPKSYEVKRMFTLPEFRGKGAASEVLEALEKWAWKQGAKRCVLETGKRQPEAIAFYQSRVYRRIPNYGQYVGVENSVCFEKQNQSHA